MWTFSQYLLYHQCAKSVIIESLEIRETVIRDIIEIIMTFDENCVFLITHIIYCYCYFKYLHNNSALIFTFSSDITIIIIIIFV